MKGSVLMPCLPKIRCNRGFISSFFPAVASGFSSDTRWNSIHLRVRCVSVAGIFHIHEMAAVINMREAALLVQSPIIE